VSDDEVTPTRMEPPASQVAQPFWDATRRKEILLQHCPACAKAIWFPRVICPTCGSAELEWHAATGRGMVYAVSVQYRPGTPQMKDRVPYAVALIDLDEGVRMMSNVLGCDAASVSVGMAVHAAWEPLTDGRNLLIFEPDEEQT
jgi:uncharacterized OB-fold protein